jgi:hypothetical protein
VGFGCQAGVEFVDSMGGGEGCGCGVIDEVVDEGEGGDAGGMW